MIVVRSPFDGSEVGRVPKCTAADVDRAVAVAGKALAAGPLPPWRRAEILDNAARLLADRVDDFARIIALESAKPFKTSRTEVERAVSTFTFAAVEARRLTGGGIMPSTGGGRRGTAGLHPPGPHLRGGGGHRPLQLPPQPGGPQAGARHRRRLPGRAQAASQTPITALALADLLVNGAGLPTDHLHVVTGTGAEVGEALVRHPDVASFTFTGSGEVGWGIKERAGRKKVALELGNNSPVVIEADGDWEAAARRVAATGFAHAGQSCVSVQRVLVQEAVAEGFEKALAAHVEELVVGDPMDESTDVSALISTDDRDRVVAWIDEAVAAGARVVTGGRVGDDGLLRPTVLADVVPDMRVCREEVFGPVVAVQASRPPTRDWRWPTTPGTGSRPASTRRAWRRPCGRPGNCTSGRSWSTRCLPGGPTRCPTAASGRAATPRRAPPPPCGR